MTWTYHLETICHFRRVEIRVSAGVYVKVIVGIRVI